jgi:hypothetical protein
VQTESVCENDVQTVSHTFFENQVVGRENLLVCGIVSGMYAECMRNVCEMEIYWKFLESLGSRHKRWKYKWQSLWRV